MRGLGRWRPRSATMLEHASARAHATTEAPAWPERRSPPLDRPAVLGHARSSTFTAGGNRKGAAAGAAWTLLLPSLELETVLCVGIPTVAGLSMLSRLAERVIVACAGDEECARALRRGAGAGLSNVEAFGPSEQPPSLEGVALAVISGGRAAARLSTTTWLSDAMGVAQAVFVDLGAGAFGSGASARVRRLTSALGPMHVLRLTPSTGEIRTAGAVADPITLASLAGLGA